MPDSLSKLNKNQKEAVTHVNGPLLIVAGAGTGKTTVLIERLSNLIKNGFAKPDEILITTFTEKAAKEMEERADKLLPYGYIDLWINTFHGFCERVLRDHCLDIGLPSDFKMITQTEQWMLLRKNLDKLDLDYYKPLGNPTKFIHEIIRHFSRLKDENISAREYLDYAEKLKLDTDTTNPEQELEIKRINELANAYHVYNLLLLDESLLDFGDLICYTIKLFKERPNILNFYREKFKFVMVDEFQDTNWSQYELIKILAAPKNNLVVVGDDDQAIYKFRGASLSNIMQFKDDFPGAKEIVLSQNYRSGQDILDVAYEFIAHNNPNRLEVKLGINKKLAAAQKEKGAVTHLHYHTEQDETEEVVKKIVELYKKEKETEWADFAILVRANDTADKFVAELTRLGIPNQFISLRGLYFKPVILDLIAYLKLLDNYHESAALFRVLNMEIFQVRHEDIVHINKFARRKAWSMYETLRNIAAVPNIDKQSVENINCLLGLIKKHSDLAQKEKVSKIYISFLNDSGLAKMDHDKHADLFDYLNQFYQRIRKFEEASPDPRLKEFMQLLELEFEAGETGSLKLNLEDNDAVKIMTVHASKGLEFRYVFIPSLVDKKFPVISRTEKISVPDELVREKLPEGDVHIEEERRLFYVALTRAKKELFLASASDYGGEREKKISKFILETGIPVQESEGKGKKQNGLLKELKSEFKEIKHPVKYALPSKFSFSQLEAYSKCPLQYKFNFILKIPVEDKVSLVFGRSIHNTLRDFLVPLLAGSTQQNLFGQTKIIYPTKEKLLELYEQNWQDDGYETKKERDAFKAKGKKIMHDFYAGIEHNGWPDVMYLEKSFNVKIGGHTLKGTIDRMDRLSGNEIEIIDYKTGTPKEKVEADQKRQLILYKIVAEEVFGLKATKLSFYYLEGGNKVSFEAKDKEVEKVKEQVIGQVEAIKKCDFTPIPGQFTCKYCDFRNICEFRKG